MLSNGVWRGLPRNEHGYRQKISLVTAWRGLDWRALPYPAFVVTVNRFDGPTPAGLNVPGQVSVREAWNSFLRSAVDLPTPGCWEITGRLTSHQELRFVVWVEP